MILKCKCPNEGQDELHGKGMRVFNVTQKQGREGSICRCSVCGAEK